MTRSSQVLRELSKPGLRIYAGKDELPRVLGGLGIAIISTNKGVSLTRKHVSFMSAEKFLHSYGDPESLMNASL